MIQHCRLPSLEAVRADLADLATSPLSEVARAEVEASREEYGRMACVFTRPFRTEADLMLGQATWWAAWQLQKAALDRERFGGLCAGRRDRRSLYGTEVWLRAAMLEARRGELQAQPLAAKHSQRNTQQRRRATEIRKLGLAITNLDAAIAQVRCSCGASSEALRAHRLICRDCRAAGSHCAHKLDLSARCADCDAQRRQRELALEGLDFLRFQQEYFHERNDCTIDDVSAGGKQLSSAARAAFDDDCHLDDDCAADIDAKLVQMQMAGLRCKVAADCVDGVGTVTAAADDFALGDDAMMQARSAKVVLTDAQRANTTKPEERVSTDAHGNRVFGTTVTDMLEALRLRRPDEPAGAVPGPSAAGAPAVDTDGLSIGAVSAKYTLNTSQHTALCCCAGALLHSLAKRLKLPESEMAKLSPHMGCVPLSDDGASRQLVMYLTGAGGTGKSEVVKALREFAQRWGIADSLCVTATTGIAACIVHGMTWHKATGHFSFVRKAKTVKVRELWSTIAMLVIDEVSMMSARQLHQLDKWLRDLKGRPHTVFGGVHLVFSGDFFQLPPVKAWTIYPDGKAVDGDDAVGRDLWRRVLNAAVVLTENHRAKLDPSYAELLRVLRTGCEDEGVWRLVKDALKSRLCGASDSGRAAWAQLELRAGAATHPAPDASDASDASIQKAEALQALGTALAAVVRKVLRRRLARGWRTWARRVWRTWERTEAMVITPKNLDRIAINTLFAKTHIAAVNASVEATNPNATWRERGVLLIDGVFHRYRPYQRNPPRYGERWQATWRRITTEESMSNKYAPVLRILIGKRYMITQNINLSRGVANGMWAIVRDVRLCEGKVPRWDKEERAFRIDADQVEGLIVRYPDSDWGSQQLHTDLPVGHFVLALDTPPTAPSGCKVFDYILGGNVKKFRISQFPLIQVPRPRPLRACAWW